MCFLGSGLFCFHLRKGVCAAYTDPKLTMGTGMALNPRPTSTFQALDLQTWTAFYMACFSFLFLLSLLLLRKGLSLAQVGLEITVLLCLSLLTARNTGMCHCPQLYGSLCGITEDLPGASTQQVLNECSF